jgi:hypothetical protein
MPLATIHVLDGRYDDRRLSNARIVASAGISPDDLMILLSEGPGENFSFGRGFAQRANISTSAAALTRQIGVEAS